MVTPAFYLIFAETIFACIVLAPFLLAAPHALLFGVPAKETIITFAASFKLTVVFAFDAKWVIGYSFVAAAFANVKITFVTAVQV